MNPKQREAALRLIDYFDNWPDEAIKPKAVELVSLLRELAA